MILLLTAAATVVGTARDARLQQHDFDAKPLQQWRLPGRLREISALALTDDERLLAVDDEQAVVYELDFVEGGLRKAFALGDPTLRQDLEGIAVIGDTVYLLTSDAQLYIAPEGRDGDRVPFRHVDTGLGSQCEFEGLAADTAGGRLLLLCKELRRKADIDTLTIFVWRIDEESIAPDEAIRLPVERIEEALDEDELHPSGIAIDRESGHLVLVAARERALIELDPDGGFLAARQLRSAKRHPQAEGIELTADGRLILADEAGKRRALLTVYGRER